MLSFGEQFIDPPPAVVITFPSITRVVILVLPLRLFFTLDEDDSICFAKLSLSKNILDAKAMLYLKIIKFRSTSTLNEIYICHRNLIMTGEDLDSKPAIYPWGPPMEEESVKVN